MKTFKTFFYTISFCLLLYSCNTNDDGFYNSQYISIPNLVEIEVKPTYNINDYIYVNSIFNRLQSEANQSTLLDLRKSTGDARAFTFSYQLEKFVNSSWEEVIPSENEINITSGELFSGGFFSVNSVYNSLVDKYQFRAGIKLTTSGLYRLSFGYNSSSTTAVEMQSISIDNNLFLNITSITNNLDGQGYYVFNVN